MDSAGLTYSTNTDQVFDPMLEYYGINIPVVNSGNYAIKLNNNVTPREENLLKTNVVKMLKEFEVESNNPTVVTYAFNFICENPYNHELLNIRGNKYEQPAFISRIRRDEDNFVIGGECLVADLTNDNFKVANEIDYDKNKPLDDRTFTDYYVNENFEYDFRAYGGDPLLYTDWECSRITIPGGNKGKRFTLEFLVLDCNKNGHYATVYIDDINLNACDNPKFGSIGLNLRSEDIGACPDLPLNICGEIRAPYEEVGAVKSYASLDKFDLVLYKEGEFLERIDKKDEINIITDGSENPFCFKLNKSDIDANLTEKLNGNYSFIVEASFKYSDGDVISKTTQPKDISFNDCSNDIPDDGTDDGTDPHICPTGNHGCCEEHIIVKDEVLASFMDPKQASLTVTAYNHINTGGYGIYHGGKELLLSNGFVSSLGSKFHGYVEGCTSQHELRLSKNDHDVTSNNLSQEEIALIRKEGDSNKEDSISIAPNPNNGVFKILFKNNISGQIQISDLKGQVVVQKDISNVLEVEISSVSFPKLELLKFLFFQIYCF